MSDAYSISRRSFVGAGLVALPGIATLSGLVRWSLKEAEYSIGFEGLPMLLVATYTDGTMSARWDGRACQIRDDGRWKRLACVSGDSICEARIRRPQPNELDVDFIAMRSPSFVRVEDFAIRPKIDFEDFSITPARYRGLLRV